MSSHGKVQAGDYVSEKMPSAGIEPATSRTSVIGLNHLTTLAIFYLLKKFDFLLTSPLFINGISLSVAFVLFQNCCDSRNIKEIIISDGGSKDETISIVNNFNKTSLIPIIVLNSPPGNNRSPHHT